MRVRQTVSGRSTGSEAPAQRVWPWQWKRHHAQLQVKFADCTDALMVKEQALAALTAKLEHLEKDLRDAREAEGRALREVGQLAAARADTERQARRLRQAVDAQQAALADLEHAAEAATVSASGRPQT